MRIATMKSRYGPIRVQVRGKRKIIVGPVGPVDRQRLTWWREDLAARMELAALRTLVGLYEPRRSEFKTIADMEQAHARGGRRTESARAASLPVTRSRAEKKRTTILELARKDPGLSRIEIARRAAQALDVPVSRQLVGRILDDRL